MGSWLMKTGMAFALQLMICTVPFVWKFPRKERFPIRAVCVAILFYCAAYGLYLLRIGVFSSLRMLHPFFFEVMWCFGVAGISACFKVGLHSALYAGIGGYILQHMVYSAMAIVRYYISTLSPLLNNVLYILPFAIVSFAFYIVLVRRNSNLSHFDDRGSVVLGLAILVFFLNIILSRLTSFGDTGDGFVAIVVCRLYSMTCCALVLVQMFGLIKQNELKQDKIILEHLFSQSQGQRRIAEDNIDFINMKCHDLKKQIAALKRIVKGEERIELIEKLERSVSIYEGVAKTGNVAIDIVLTEFSWRCSNNAIQFDYMINGKDFDFMASEDVYSLFYNALDNATESVLREESPEKRMISIHSELQGDMLYILILNYCCDKPVFMNGIPLTTKPDKEFHGYGTKSIRYIVEKYEGTVDMNLTEDHFFQLQILLNRRNRERHMLTQTASD